MACLNKGNANARGLVIFARIPDIPHVRILFSELTATLISKHLAKGLGGEKPDFIFIDLELLLELGDDIVEEGGAVAIKLFDEVVRSADFGKVVILGMLNNDVCEVLADITLELVCGGIADFYCKSVGSLVHAGVLIEELGHDGVKDGMRHGLGLVDEGNENVSYANLNVLGKVIADEGEQVAKDFSHELVGMM